ncbi:MAG: DUF4286 family protein, partial [Steroidobacteraceae bacterium]
MRPADASDAVLYEVNLDADAAIEAPFDTWLRDHVADVLQFDGFLAAEILADPDPPPGRARRSVLYRLRDRAALDLYLREQAEPMQRRGRELFGDRFTATRRTLAHREEFIRGTVSTENCLNCGEVLTGQHCAHCGQRSRVRVLSLGGLLRDLLGDLTDFDSRIWRTLRPLAFKPGWLTTEYLRGRRTLYTPPVRMYLILSVVFFLATSIGADPGGAIEFGPGVSSNGDAGSGSGAQPVPGPALSAEQRRIIEAIASKLPPTQQAEARRDLERDIASMQPEAVERMARLASDPCGPDNLK